MAKIWGILERAQAEHVSSLPSGIIGRLVYLTTVDGGNQPGFYYHNGSSWRNIADINSGQALSNKTFSDHLYIGTGSRDASARFQVDSTTQGSAPFPRMTTAQRDAIGTPLTGLSIYNTDTLQPEQYNGVSWVAMGGGGGEAGINYVVNPNAEVDASDWAAYADAAAATPVDGTGGSPSVTFARNTTTPLRGLGDFLLTKDAADRQGEGVSTDIEIDTADQAKVLRIMFDYKTSSNYADGDIRVYIYDITNAQLIEPTVRDLAAVGGNGLYVSEFQSNSNSVDYRLIFHVASGNANAYTVNLDNVTVGPREIARGPIITEQQEYTPTLNSLTGVSFRRGYFRRVGGYAEIHGSVEFNGAGASGDFTFSLPPGLSLDTTKGNFGSSASNTLGYWNWYDDAGSAATRDGAVNMLSANPTTLLFRRSDTSSALNSNVFANNDRITFVVLVPILGWGASSTISSDFGGRSLSTYAYRTSNQTGVNPNSTSVLVEINSVTPTTLGRGFDDAASFNTSTYKYVCQESGEFDVVSNVAVLGTNVLNSAYKLLIFIDNTYAMEGPDVVPNAGTGFVASISGKFKLNKGQSIDVRLFGVGNNSVNTLTIAPTANSTFMLVSKRATPQSLAGGEKCEAIVRMTATQNITGGVGTVIFNDKIKDTHNAYSTANGRFTSPKPGTAKVKGVIHLSDITGGTLAQIQLVREGTNIRSIDTYVRPNDGNKRCVSVDFQTPILEGQYLLLQFVGSDTDINVDQSSGGVDFTCVTYEVV